MQVGATGSGMHSPLLGAFYDKAQRSYVLVLAHIPGRNLFDHAVSCPAAGHQDARCCTVAH